MRICKSFWLICFSEAFEDAKNKTKKGSYQRAKLWLERFEQRFMRFQQLQLASFKTPNVARRKIVIFGLSRR